MKQGWKTCKFADVFDLQMGKTPSRDNPTYWGDDNMWVSIADMNEQKYMSATKEGITDVAVQESGIKPIPKGTVIMSFKLSIGKVSIATSKLYTNEAIMGFIEKEEGNLVPEYLYYYLKGYKWEGANKAAMGMTLNKKTIAESTISYPPVAEQAKIVEELDCLSGIIEKKKQQLKELDNLAQSIFYEMFGDPVENDKGWEMKRLGDVSDVTSFKRVLIEDVVEEGVPFIRGTELSALSKLPNSKNYEFTLFITPEHYNKVKAISGVPVIGDLLIPSINADGLIWVVDTNEPRYYKDGRVLWVHTNREYSNSTALRYIMSNKLRLLYKELASGATFIELKLFVLRDMVLPFPPLTLQQDFASKIESIEKQKELIVQSIKEAETLFNSRMDYYFN